MPSFRPLVPPIALVLLTACTPFCASSPLALAGRCSPGTWDQLTKSDRASYPDIVADRGNGLHLLYADGSADHDGRGVYYRESYDDGAQWSDPVALADADASHNAGFVRLIADGSGKLYAFWKSLPPGGGADKAIDGPSGGTMPGTLTLRVLDGDRWSAPITIGQANNVYAWFPAVAPDGQLYVVWNEGLTVPSAPITNEGDGTGLVLQASVTGIAVGQPTELVHARASASTGRKYDSYYGLRGYVDRDGVAHFVAVEAPAATPTTYQVVHWDGRAMTTLFPYTRHVKAPNLQTDSPPQLLLDAEGAETLLVRSETADLPGVYQLPLAGSGAPIPVLTARDAGGTVGNFQVTALPYNTIGVTATIRPSAAQGAVPDIYFSQTSGGAWLPARNVTRGQERIQIVRPASGGEEVSSAPWDPQYAAVFEGPSIPMGVAMLTNETIGASPRPGSASSVPASNVYVFERGAMCNPLEPPVASSSPSATPPPPTSAPAPSPGKAGR